MVNMIDVISNLRSRIEKRKNEEKLDKLLIEDIVVEKEGRVNLYLKINDKEYMLLRVEAISVDNGRVLFVIQWLEEEMAKLHLCGKPEEKMYDAVSKEAFREIKRLYKAVVNNI